MKKLIVVLSVLAGLAAPAKAGMFYSNDVSATSDTMRVAGVVKIADPATPYVPTITLNGVGGQATFGPVTMTSGTITGAGMRFATSGEILLSETTDGSDSRYWQISPAGAIGNNRGSYINMGGNEATGVSLGGKLQLIAGNVATGDIDLIAGAGLKRFSVLNTGDLLFGSGETLLVSTYTYATGGLALAGDLTTGGKIGAGGVVGGAGFNLRVEGGAQFNEAGDANNFLQLQASGDLIYYDSFGTAANSGGHVFRVSDASKVALTLDATGGAGLYPRTKAQLLTIAAPVGALYYCSDCADATSGKPTVVIATGTSAGNFGTMPVGNFQ